MVGTRLPRLRAGWWEVRNGYIGHIHFLMCCPAVWVAGSMWLAPRELPAIFVTLPPCNQACPALGPLRPSRFLVYILYPGRLVPSAGGASYL